MKIEDSQDKNIVLKMNFGIRQVLRNRLASFYQKPHKCQLNHSKGSGGIQFRDLLET
jgi:hypothetical protein